MRVFILFCLVASLASCSKKTESLGETAETVATKDFLPGTKIIYSANINGEIEPCGCRGNPTGGLQRRWNWLKQTVSAGDSILSIDSGDLFYPSTPVPPFLEKQWNLQADALVTAYNSMKVEAMAPGELDFAAGIEQFDKLRSRAKFKILSANLYRSGQPLTEPYIILKKGGNRVALFGLYDETMALPEELEAKNHIETAKAVVKELRGKADVVIALTHLGLEKDELLAKQVPGIDAIFGAHTQSFLTTPEKIGDTLIFQTSFRGQHLGLYANSQNTLEQLDTRFDSPAGNPNPMDTMLEQAKARIAQLNRELEAELAIEPTGKSKLQRIADAPAYQTFPKCAECHAPQYAFYSKTQHAHAYATLVAKKQNANYDCLKCHTLGLQQPGGYKHVDKLVFNRNGKEVSAEAFARSLPNLDVKALSKISKAFINVQCETCHGTGGNHPIQSPNGFSKTVSSSTCLTCHTPQQAPGWYKDGKPDKDLIQAKIKSVSCPPSNN